MTPDETPLSDVQRDLLHDALRDIEHAKYRLKSITLLQRYSGQPKLMRACDEMQEALQSIWHLLDGLDHRQR